MEIDVLKYVLLRCKIVDIFPVLKKWNFMKESCYSEVNFKAKKRDIADKIVELCKVSYQHVENLWLSSLFIQYRNINIIFVCVCVEY